MRKRWKSIAFSTAPVQIIDGDRGKNYPKQNDYSDSGFCVFLNTGNVTESGFSFNSVQFISEEKDDALRKGKLKRNDVVMTTRGTIGNVAHYHEKIPFDNMRINSGMVIFRCEQSQLSPLFLYHFLRSPNFYGQVNALQSGVAQPQLPIRDVNRITLSLPPIDEQSRIANFISNYDDLIENNRRRIQLLEQSTRLLYKEWFVHIRFPGHEHVKIKDGVPEGREKKSLGEIAPLRYGRALKEDDRVPGPFPVYGSSGIIGTHHKALTSGPAIIVGRKGNVGSVFMSPDDFHPIDTVYFIERSNCTIYLYYALLHTSFTSTDVAVPGLNRDFAHSRKIMSPEPKILKLFEEFAAPLHEKI